VSEPREDLRTTPTDTHAPHICRPHRLHTCARCSGDATHATDLTVRLDRKFYQRGRSRAAGIMPALRAPARVSPSGVTRIPDGGYCIHLTSTEGRCLPLLLQGERHHNRSQHTRAMLCFCNCPRRRRPHSLGSGVAAIRYCMAGPSADAAGHGSPYPQRTAACGSVAFRCNSGRAFPFDPGSNS
jgi:hypothetical protein